ncbi:MAG: hypothetical protein JST19_08775 [Bacteroidetes bacterium]|nr:hypothetical protein [Bacteroidota bacterium]
MKKFISILFIVLGAFACKKGGISPSGGLYGKWELHKTYGGFIQQPDSVYQPGNGNILQFSSDGTYKRYTDGTLSAQGVYSIRNNNLIFDNDTPGATISIANSILTVSPLIPDIGSSQYLKISN